MAQHKTKLSVLPTSDQPTRGLESYVGEQYHDPDHRFSLHHYHSSYLQERTRRQALYNSIPFEELQAKIKNSFCTETSQEVIDLNSILTKYVIFLEPSALNPLDRPQTQKVSSLLDFFKKLLHQKTKVVEKEWKERERKIRSPSLPFKYKKEEMVGLDNLTREYIQLASTSWLRGQFQMLGNEYILNYEKTIGGINHFEETFWQPYLHKYQSAIFKTMKEIEEEKKYLQHYYQEQFSFPSTQVPLHQLRLQASLPHRLLQEMDYLQDNLASCNEVKLFIQMKLRSLDEDRKSVSVPGKSLDSLTEMKSKYPPVSHQFPHFGSQLLYFGSLASTYEQQREDLHKILREQELTLEQQRTAERKSRDNHFLHPLVISLEPFDLSVYVQRYTPSAPEMQKVQKLLLSDDSWEGKINRLSPLLDKKPSFYSERDKDFLHSIIFALKTSQKEGMLEYLCREKPALHQKIKGALSKLEDYAQNYTS